MKPIRPLLLLLMLPAIALASDALVQVQSVAGGLDREQAQETLGARASELGECLRDDASSALATLRVSRSGRVASVRFMESTGDESVDRCLSRTLNGVQFGRSNGRSTVYVAIHAE